MAMLVSELITLLQAKTAGDKVHIEYPPKTGLFREIETVREVQDDHVVIVVKDL